MLILSEYWDAALTFIFICYFNDFEIINKSVHSFSSQ
jgi:hypothetical protein